MIAGLLPIVMGVVVSVVPLDMPSGREAPITLGKLLLVAVVVPAWVVLATFLGPPRELVAADPPTYKVKGWRVLWVPFGLGVPGAALWIGLDETLFTMPKWAVFGAGFPLLMTGLVVSRKSRPPGPR